MYLLIFITPSGEITFAETFYAVHEGTATVRVKVIRRGYVGNIARIGEKIYKTTTLQSV